MKGRRTWAAALLAAMVLTACGGGGGSTPALVALDVPAVTLNASQSQAVAAALNGQAITFPAGITINNTLIPGPATLTFTNGGTNFTVTGGGITASGTVAFGSIQFTVTSSTPPGAVPLGSSAFLQFLIDLNTASQAANGSARSVTATITIGNATSASLNITITINANGTIVINNVTITTATTTTGTGATGGG